MHYGTVILVGLGALLVGAVIAWMASQLLIRKRIGSAEQEATRIAAQAEKEAANITKKAVLEAKDIENKLRHDVEQEAREKQKDLKRTEELLRTREANMEKKIALLDQREQELSKREQKVEKTNQRADERLLEVEEKLQQQVDELQRIIGMTREEALAMLTDKLHDEVKLRAAKRIKESVDELKEKAQEEATRIIATSVQRYAGEYVTERTVSVVPLPNDDMKGRVIGREGRNIRAIEAATGIDVIIDDTPEAIILSGMDPVRREVARLSLLKLIEDGRIHPGRIEDVVKSSQASVDKKVKEYGERAVFDMGVHGIHPELMKLLGQLRYRYSYSQNVWAHSIEVGFLAGMMAAELNLSVKKARRAGLLHDIGKALTHEQEGSHALIGAELARKYGEAKEIIHAIEAHHEDVPIETPLAILVQAADALSGARPGARRELMEQYIKRINDLEDIANGFQGVEKSYAIQAGRELRVIVQANRVSDDLAVVMSEDIAKRIEDQMTYPGTVKVTVIRETRATAVAK